jgi:hypothetical protein
MFLDNKQVKDRSDAVSSILGYKPRFNHGFRLQSGPVINRLPKPSKLDHDRTRPNRGNTIPRPNTFVRNHRAQINLNKGI